MRHAAKHGRGFRLVFVFLCVQLLLLPGCSQGKSPAGPLYRVADRAHQSLTDALFDNIDSQLFFVGEHHDNPHHHFNQLELIREIHEKAESPMAIGLEMFETTYQTYLDQWVAKTLPAEDFVKIYYENWDQPWVLYRDIFLYAREHGIPLIALNIPRRVVRKVARQGFESLTPEDLSELPEGITCDVTPEYRTFIQRVFGWHGQRNDSFTSFCEAQVLWDTIMAINILKYHEQNGQTKMVVLAGDGHAWKPGIPRQITARKDMAMTVFLPETPKLDRSSVTRKDADYLWLFEVI